MTPANEGSEAKKRPSYLKILSNRSFFSLWFGQLVSVSGDAIFDVALLWLVLTTTGSVFLVGITQAVIYLPTVVVGPLAGVYVDRFNRKTVILFSNVIQGIIVAAISFLYVANALPIQLLLVLVFAMYSAGRFFYAATRAMIPRLAEERRDLVAANSLFTLTTSFNQFASYAFGGIAIVILGVVLPIEYDSFTFFFAAFMTLFIVKRYGEVVGQADRILPSPPKKSFGFDFTEGLRHFLSSKLLIELVVLGAVINFSLGGVFALLAPYAKFRIGGNASTYGFILAAFSLGLFAGAYLVGKLRNVREFVGTLLFAVVIALGAVIAFIGLSNTQFVSFGLFFILGFLLSIANVPLNALFQAKIPQVVFGRVITVITALLGVAQPVSAVVSGGVATVFSIGGAYTAYGILAISISIAAYFTFNELRTTKY